MVTHLALGLCNEPEAPLVTEHAAGSADGKGAGVPERAEPTRDLSQFVEALLAPGQVIELLIGGLLHLRLDSAVPGNSSMALVERLCGNFTGMIDPHQAGRVRPLCGIEFACSHCCRRTWACCLTCRSGNRAKGIVCPGQQAVNCGEFTICHKFIIANPRSLTLYSAAIFCGNRYFFRRKFMTLRLISALVVISASFSAMAQEEPESPWSGKATLGYLATSGNTENSTLNSGVEVGFATGKWQHLAAATAISASDNEVATAEAYGLGWKSERNLTDTDFLFGRLAWRKDRFSGYDSQFSQTVGYGRRLINTDKHVLNMEVGAGSRQSKLNTGITENEAIFRGGVYYKWLFSETAVFRQDLTTEAGSSNTYLESVSAISAKLMGDLALVASFTVKSNTDVPPLTEKTDTYTALSLEYLF